MQVIDLDPKSKADAGEFPGASLYLAAFGLMPGLMVLLAAMVTFPVVAFAVGLLALVGAGGVTAWLRRRATDLPADPVGQ